MNPIVELADGTLIDVRVVYKIDRHITEVSDKLYYNIHYIDGNKVGIYESGFPREKFVEIWKRCIMEEPQQRKVRSFRHIELEKKDEGND